MSEKKPTPLLAQPRGAICPVCGSRTYSQGGIHPQCAVRQADAARAEGIKASRKLDAAKTKPWRSKACPKCRKELQARRRVCDCGYIF